MTDRELSNVNEQTQRALEALNSLQRESDNDASAAAAAAAESDGAAQRPSFKLLSAEESARDGLGDVFELPVEYEDDDEDGELDNTNGIEAKRGNINSASSTQSYSRGQSVGEVVAGVSERTAEPKLIDNSKGGPVEGQEEDALINRVGHQQQSGYKSRMQELEFRRRLLATVVVVLIGAAIATLIAFVVYKSGVVDGKYRLSQHPHGLGEKNHLKGSAPESTHAHAHKMPPAFPGIGAEGSIGQDVVASSAASDERQDVLIGTVAKKDEGGATAQSSREHSEAQKKAKRTSKKKPRLEGQGGENHKASATKSNENSASNNLSEDQPEPVPAE